MIKKFYPATQEQAKTFKDKIMIVKASHDITDVDVSYIFALSGSEAVRKVCDAWEAFDFICPPSYGPWVFEGKIDIELIKDTDMFSLGADHVENRFDIRGRWRRLTLKELKWFGKTDGECMSPPKPWVEYLPHICWLDTCRIDVG